MKNIKQILERRAGIIGMVCLLAVSLSACVRDNYYEGYGNNNSINNNPNANSQPPAYLSVIDASPTSPTLDYYLNTSHVASNLTYGHTIDYFAAYTGLRTSTFYTTGTTTIFKSDTMTLKANNYYSLYLANLPSKPDFLLLTDTLSQPATNTASIRFVDLSTDAPAVDLGIKGGALITANKSYKGYSSFIPVTGNTTYTFEVRQAGTSTVLVSLSNITLSSGAIYTVWLHGLAAATDQTRLTLDIRTNGYY